MLSGHRFELIAQRVVIASLETALLPLPLAGFDEVLEAPGTLRRGRSAFGAPPISLHPQLIFSLPGNRQFREFIFDWSSHFVFRQ
jgi:hypothetical protein